MMDLMIGVLVWLSPAGPTTVDVCYATNGPAIWAFGLTIESDSYVTRIDWPEDTGGWSGGAGYRQTRLDGGGWVIQTTGALTHGTTGGTLCRLETDGLGSMRWASRTRWPDTIAWAPMTFCHAVDGPMEGGQRMFILDGDVARSIVVWVEGQWACPGDVTMDGTVDSADLATVLADYGGRWSLTDLSHVLGAMGQDCPR